MGHSLSAGWTGLLSVVVAMTAAWPLWLSLLLALLGAVSYTHLTLPTKA